MLTNTGIFVHDRESTVIQFTGIGLLEGIICFYGGSGALYHQPDDKSSRRKFVGCEGSKVILQCLVLVFLATACDIVDIGPQTLPCGTPAFVVYPYLLVVPPI